MPDQDSSALQSCDGNESNGVCVSLPLLGKLLRWAEANVTISLIGGGLFAVLETAAMYHTTTKHIVAPHIPWRYIVAHVGVVFMTHLFVWPPLFLVATLVCLRIKSLSRQSPYVVLCGVLVFVAAGLEIFAYSRYVRSVLSFRAAICLGVFLLAIFAVFCLLPRCIRRSEKNVRKVAAVGAALSLLGGGWASVVLSDTAWFSPSEYRMPEVHPAPHKSGRMNILWIVLDTVRRDALSVYNTNPGSTPYLEEWAKSVLVCENAYASSIWTLPTHSSMFTGKHARNHGTYFLQRVLPSELPTVAETLTLAGYDTCAISCNQLVSPATRLTHGFSDVSVVAHWRNFEEYSGQTLCRRWGWQPHLPWQDKDYGAAMVTEQVAEWLNQPSRGDDPFFLFINLMEAHLPYQVPAEYRRMYMTEEQFARSYVLAERAYGKLAHAFPAGHNLKGAVPVLESDEEILRLQYKAALRYLDDRLRELLMTLGRGGWLDNTMVVVCADHGEYLGEHGRWGHYCGVYKEVTNVPLLIKMPGQREGVRLSTPVQQVDLYQTLLTAAMGKCPADLEFDSQDILSLVDGGVENRMAVSEYFGPHNKLLWPNGNIRLPKFEAMKYGRVAVTDSRFKYVYSEFGDNALYDIGEAVNLIEDREKSLELFEAYLAFWASKVPGATEGATTEEVSEEKLDALRGLGYIGG